MRNLGWCIDYLVRRTQKYMKNSKTAFRLKTWKNSNFTRTAQVISLMRKFSHFTAKRKSLLQCKILHRLCKKRYQDTGFTEEKLLCQKSALKDEIFWDRKKELEVRNFFSVYILKPQTHLTSLLPALFLLMLKTLLYFSSVLLIRGYFSV